MGLLEYHAGHPSLHYVAHDGWLCTFTIYKSSWKFHQHAAASARATGTVRKRQAVPPVHHVQNHTCWVTLLQRVSSEFVFEQVCSLVTLLFVV